MLTTNARQKTTSDNVPRAEQKEFAQKHYHDAFYLGTDGTGADHWWSIYHQAIIAFEPSGSVISMDFPEGKELPDWLACIETERGWETLRYTEGTNDQFVEAIKA